MNEIALNQIRVLPPINCVHLNLLLAIPLKQVLIYPVEIIHKQGTELAARRVPFEEYMLSAFKQVKELLATGDVRHQSSRSPIVGLG